MRTCMGLKYALECWSLQKYRYPYRCFFSSNEKKITNTEKKNLCLFICISRKRKKIVQIAPNILYEQLNVIKQGNSNCVMRP